MERLVLSLLLTNAETLGKIMKSPEFLLSGGCPGWPILSQNCHGVVISRTIFFQTSLGSYVLFCRMRDFAFLHHIKFSRWISCIMSYFYFLFKWMMLHSLMFLKEYHWTLSQQTRLGCIAYKIFTAPAKELWIINTSYLNDDRLFHIFKLGFGGAVKVFPVSL